MISPCLVVIVILLSPLVGSAYEGGAHSGINKTALLLNTALRAVPGSVDLDGVLRNAGWAPAGTGTPLAGVKIDKIISDIGGPGEDEPKARCLNHFLDYTWSTGLFSIFPNAADWATNYNASSWNDYEPIQAGSAFYGDDYSWPAALNHYFMGLTGYGWVPNGLGVTWTRVAATQPEREEHLAHVFRALGQVMHLVADMSVPAHVRNDAHLFAGVPSWQSGLFGATINYLAGDEYEAWAAGPGRQSFSQAASMAAAAVTLDGLSFQTPQGAANARVESYFGNYASFEDAAAGIRPPGLAEFTGFNFVSQDTMFDFAHPHPRLPYDRARLTRQGPGSPYWSYRISSGVAVPRYVRDNFIAGALRNQYIRLPELVALSLDEHCYEDHAQVLAPQAVSYAAGVLARFFAYEVVAEISTRGAQTSVHYRVIRAGSRTAQNPEGDLAEGVSASVYVVGLSGAQSEATFLASAPPEGVVSTGSVALPWNAGCFDELRVVCAGRDEHGPWIAGSAVRAQLHVAASPGQPFLSNVNVALVQPHGNGCAAPAIALDPTAAAGTISVAAVVDDHGTEMPLGDSVWPLWSAGPNPPVSFRHYRVRFLGTLDGVPGVPLSADYGEVVQEGFVPSQTTLTWSETYPSQRTSGDVGSVTWQQWGDAFDFGASWTRGTWDYAATNQAHRWTVAQTLENGALRSHYTDLADPDLYAGSTWPACLEDTLKWQTGPELGDAAHPRLMTADSVVEVDATVALPQGGRISVGFWLRDPGQGVDQPATVFLPQNGQWAVRLGDQRPDLFSGGRTYSLPQPATVTLGFHGCETRSEEVPAGSGTRVPVQHDRDVSVRAVRIFP